VTIKQQEHLKMAYEVDFLPVGDGERCGDAITLRFGNLAGDRSQYQVWVIDGGTKESGEALVAHIQKHYRANRVDVVVSTHPDADHSSGLSVVLEQIDVGLLVMHQPWNHAEEIQHLFDDERVTPSGIEERVWRALENARELEKIATRKGIPIREPFSDDFKCVLSPSKAFYEQQLANFRCMPEAAQKNAMAQLIEALIGKAREAARAAETWFRETLADPDPDATTAENNSSVVLLFELDGKKWLFTADAGVPAMMEAANRAAALAMDLKTVTFVQVPHHGSKRNVGPTILNRIIGPIKPTESYDKTAFISASKDGQPKHPAKKVINAFKRRGANVFATQGKGLWHHSNDAPQRPGWSAAQPLPFYNEVDE
jgi:beta-lactamase superfamily II metal-dependent hydrolase